MYKGKPVYIKNIQGNMNVEVVETISKMDHKVHVSNLDLIERSGVNVYLLN